MTDETVSTEEAPAPEPFVATASYEVETSIKGSTHHGILGRIEFDFTAGTVTPKSEADEFVLTVFLGLEPVKPSRKAEPVKLKVKED